MEISIKQILAILGANPDITIVGNSKVMNAFTKEINGKNSLNLVYHGRTNQPAIYVNIEEVELMDNQIWIKTSLSKRALESYLQKKLFEEIGIVFELLSMVHQNKTLDDLMNYMNSVLHNPIILYDRSFHVLAYTKGDMIEHHYWKDIVELGGVEELNEELSHGFISFSQSLDSYAEPTRVSDAVLLSPFIICNVLYKNKRIGSLCVAEFHHSSNILEMQRIASFCAILTFELQKSLAVPEAEDLAEQFMLDLTGGKTSTKSLIQANLRTISFNPKKYFYLVGIDCGLDEYTQRAIKRKISSVTKDFLVTINNFNVFLFTCDSLEVNYKICETLKEVSSEYNALIYISDFYQELSETKYFYQQLLLIKKYSHTKICSFQDIKITYLMDAYDEHYHEVDILPLVVRQIKEYDDDNHSEYLKTLASYIDNYLHQKDTADELHIHRSTLLYRLEKIQELFSVNFEDKESLFLIQLALKYLKSRNKI